MKKNYLTLSLLFLVCACGEIKAPGPEIVVRTQETDLGSTVYSMRFQYDRHRNAIYIAVDNQVQKYFDKQAVDFFGENPPRIEELSWWIYAKPLRRIYDDILVIPYNRFSKESLYEALEYMESKNETYDLYLMTHGIHNHITTSKGYDMLSYEDIDELKGSLAYLNLVYMQSCFGSTLSQDWLDAGANYVISYPDFNRNFFYLEFFLDQYGPQRKHPDKAYERTNKALYRKMKNNPLYAQLLEAMDLSLEDYEEMSEYPEFFSK